MSRRVFWHSILRARPPPMRQCGCDQPEVSGVSVFRRRLYRTEGSETILLNDVRHGTYKKLVISEGRSPARCWSAMSKARSGISN